MSGPEDPGAQEDEAEGGGRQVRRGEDRQLRQLRRPVGHRGRVQQRDGAGRQRQREGDHQQSLEVVAEQASAAADRERHPPVGGGVADRGQQQRQRVRRLRGQSLPEQQEQHGVRHGAHHPDRGEPQHLPRGAHRRGVGGPAAGGYAVQRDPPRPQRPSEAHHAAEVVQGGAHEVHPAVGVVGPVDRHLVDPQAGALGEHQELGVEEPRLILHQGQQRGGGVRADRLEATLSVAETGGQRRVQQQVVGARDHLAPRAPAHPGRARQSGPDGHVAVPGDERGEQREEGVEVGGQVDVHVREHVRVGGGPGLPQGAATALLGQGHHAHARKLRRQLRSRPGRAVGARVVGDRHGAAERQTRGRVPVQPAHGRPEVAHLVVDRDDDVDRRRPRGDTWPGAGGDLLDPHVVERVESSAVSPAPGPGPSPPAGGNVPAKSRSTSCSSPEDDG